MVIHEKNQLMDDVTISFDLTDDWFLLFESEICLQKNITFIKNVNEKSKISVSYPYITSNKYWPFRYIRLDPVTNYYTTYNYPIFKDIENIDNFWPLLKPRNWCICVLGPLPKNGKLYDYILLNAAKTGFLTHSYFQYVNWYLEVDDRDYLTYFSQLPSHLKNTIRRKSKKILSNEDLKIEIIFANEIVQDKISDYEKVYSNSWKNEETYPEFIRKMIACFMSKGWVRLGFVYYKNIPIATQLWIVKDKIAYIYKLAYDEKFKNISAGSVLTAKLMEYVIDIDKVTKVDFLTGDDSYKKDWMSDSRELWNVIVYANTWKGKLLAYSKKLKSKCKSALQLVGFKY